jgi:hypothetical protein
MKTAKQLHKKALEWDKTEKRWESRCDDTDPVTRSAANTITRLASQASARLRRQAAELICKKNP